MPPILVKENKRYRQALKLLDSLLRNETIKKTRRGHAILSHYRGE